MQIIVLGMHRSGTSVTGQLLQSLGFQFGPETQAAAPKKDNPKGYWERVDVGNLNNDAFAQVGGTWDRVAHWTPSTLSKGFLEEFNQRARSIIDTYPAGEPWFVKDPRLCLTLPLWEPHLDAPVYLFVYRDPVEIIRSLWTRNRHSPSVVAALWERYVGDAANFTRGKRRLMIRYSDLLENPEETLRNLVDGLRRLGVEPPCPPEVALGKLLLDRSLRHHKNEKEGTFALTPRQEALRQRFQDGSLLLADEEVDVTAANAEIAAYQAMREEGRSRTLESGLLPALEQLHLLGHHIGRGIPGALRGDDYGALLLVEKGSTLAKWRIWTQQYRKAKRLVVAFLRKRPDNLARFIRAFGVNVEKHWVEKLSLVTSLCEELLGLLVLNRFGALPREEREAIVRRLLAEVEPLTLELKRLREGPAIAQAEPVEVRIAKLAQLEGLCRSLVNGYPWQAEFRNAARDLAAFRAEEKGSFEIRDAERAGHFLPTLEAAKAALEAFLRSPAMQGG